MRWTPKIGRADKVWFAWRQARSNDQRVWIYWTKDFRNRWPNLLGCLGKSASVAAVCWLTVYVWFVPALITAAEDEFQYKMRHARDPQGYRADLKVVRDEIASSETEMQAIRESVDAELNAGEEKDQ